MTAVESECAADSPADGPVTPEVIDDVTPESPADGPVTPDPAEPAGEAPTQDPTEPPREINEPVLPEVPEGADAAQPATERVAPPAPTRRRALLVAAAVLLVLVAAVIGGVAGGLAVLDLRPPVAPATTPPPAPGDLVAAVAGVLPAVLRIQAGAPDTGTAGTAVVLTPTGDVVTNEHLVHGQSTATLIAPDGRRSTARVVATDGKADLAWLRIDGAANLPVAHLAGGGAVRLGEDVVAIGNALNLDGAPSISRGVVSAVGRSTQTLSNVIQTDAAISSGSSGGALVDGSGAVVGITTEAVVGDASVSVEDIAFAIPSDRVVSVLAGMGLVLPPGR